MRRKFTRTEKANLKKAKAMHKKEQRLDPSWFEARRVDLGSQLVTAVATRLPRWGGFNFVFTKNGI